MGRPKVITVTEASEEAKIAARLEAEREGKEKQRLKGNQLAVALRDAFALKKLNPASK